MIELVNKMPIKKCPVCGNTVLWLKEVRKVKDGYSVLYKCDNCAYVNTTLPCIVKTDEYFFCGDYMQIGILANTSGYVESIKGKLEDRLIGRDFWFDNELNVKGKANCPHCGKPLKVDKINPFKRYNQYRCDIITHCEEGHLSAFGVHITEEDFEKLSVR